jgi:phosphate uptake regulator
MKRKIIKLGKSSLAISLPNDWIKTNSVLKGEEVFVYNEDNKLIITLDYVNKLSHTRLHLYDKDEILKAYHNGENLVVINIRNTSEIEEIRNLLINLIGADILKIEKNELTISINTYEVDIDFSYYYNKLIQIIIWSLKNYYLNIDNYEFELSHLINDFNQKHDFLLRKLTENRLSKNVIFYLLVLPHVNELFGFSTALIRNVNPSKESVDYTINSLNKLLIKKDYSYNKIFCSFFDNNIIEFKINTLSKIFFEYYKSR